MDTTPTDLDYFYRNLFPAEQLYAWTQYGQQDPKETVKREYSITLSTPENTDGIFVRYNACMTSTKFREMLYTRRGGSIAWISKLDIGPKFNGDVSRHKEQSLSPEEKELVFDIDMDEYNPVRTCCQDKKVCTACFAFLSAAAKILHYLLTDTFNFKHILFVFSGRRGIHCWISDYEARILTARQREGLASYLHSGLQENKKQSLAIMTHPVLQASYEILKDDFPKLFQTQNFFHSDVQRNQIIARYFDGNYETDDKHPIRGYASHLNKPTPEQAWQALVARASKNGQMVGIYRIVLDYLYPRLDIEVSKQFNHLLKSPFCIHPATGKVCVPIPYEEIETFNPDTVPTLTQIINEHKTAAETFKNKKNNTIRPNDLGLSFPNQTELPQYITPVPPAGVLSTSLRKYVEFFTDFTMKVVKAEIERKMDEKDALAALGFIA